MNYFGGEARKNKHYGRVVCYCTVSCCADLTRPAQWTPHMCTVSHFQLNAHWDNACARTVGCGVLHMATDTQNRSAHTPETLGLDILSRAFNCSGTEFRRRAFFVDLSDGSAIHNRQFSATTRHSRHATVESSNEVHLSKLCSHFLRRCT